MSKWDVEPDMIFGSVRNKRGAIVDWIVSDTRDEAARLLFLHNPKAHTVATSIARGSVNGKHMHVFVYAWVAYSDTGLDIRWTNRRADVDYTKYVEVAQ